MQRTRHPMSVWFMVLTQLERTRIAAVQAPPPIDYHVSPPLAESLGSVRPRQEARRAIFLTDHHDSQETSQAESCCARGCREAQGAPEHVLA